MVTKEEKGYLELLGLILVAVGIGAFFYQEQFILYYYPYRDYALPIGILGIIVLLIGIIAPESKSVN